MKLVLFGRVSVLQLSAYNRDCDLGQTFVLTSEDLGANVATSSIQYRLQHLVVCKLVQVFVLVKFTLVWQ